MVGSSAVRFLRVLFLFLLVLFVAFPKSWCSESPNDGNRNNNIGGFAEDKELLAAMEIFVGMSPEEREETIRDLMATVGDDEDKRREMETLIKMLPEMESNDSSSSSLKQMIRDDEIAKAKHQASEMLDGSDWGSFWGNQEEILEAVVASGQLRPEDAALFKTDEEAWKKQLRIIWDDLQKQKA